MYKRQHKTVSLHLHFFHKPSLVCYKGIANIPMVIYQGLKAWYYGDTRRAGIESWTPSIITLSHNHQTTNHWITIQATYLTCIILSSLHVIPLHVFLNTDIAGICHTTSVMFGYDRKEQFYETLLWKVTFHYKAIPLLKVFLLISISIIWLEIFIFSSTADYNKTGYIR